MGYKIVRGLYSPPLPAHTQTLRRLRTWVKRGFNILPLDHGFYVENHIHLELCNLQELSIVRELTNRIIGIAIPDKISDQVTEELKDSLLALHHKCTRVETRVFIQQTLHWLERNYGTGFKYPPRGYCSSCGNTVSVVPEQLEFIESTDELVEALEMNNRTFLTTSHNLHDGHTCKGTGMKATHHVW